MLNYLSKIKFNANKLPFPLHTEISPSIKKKKQKQNHHHHNNFNVNHIQGANVAQIGCSIWMPLNGDATNTTHIIPDLTVFDLNGLLHILPISEICSLGSSVSTTMMTTPTSTTPPTPTTTTTTKLTTTLLTVTTRKSYGSNRRGAHTAIRNLPDLENGNSNSSDGS